MTWSNLKESALHRRGRACWHRRLGLVVSTVLLVIVITGLTLNHVDRLGLDRKLVTNQALLDWYGTEPQGSPISYRIGTNWLTWLQGSLYLNDRPLGETAGAVKGAVAVQDIFVIAAPRALLVFTNGGSLVEKLSGAGLPGLIEAIGLAEDGRVMLRTPVGAFSAVGDFIDWTPSVAPVDWARPAPLPSGLEAAIMNAYRGGGLPWSRLLLDIHTGRIFGAWGPYLIDATALALLALIGTGIHNWASRKR